MDFIYRIPLIDFDPKNQEEITKHWEKIKTNISYSSESLYQQLNERTYSELAVDTRLSLLKYLLRGRYRATPFGKWSAVGVGCWAEASSRKVGLSTEEIPGHFSLEDLAEPSFSLAPCADIAFGMIHYYQFDQNDNRWTYCLIEQNKILDKILAHFHENQAINFPNFSHWFIGIEVPAIRKVWNKILKTGIILNPAILKSPSISKNINLKALDQIQLSKQIKNELDRFTAKSGALFSAHPRVILEKFKTLFHEKYDDRWVSLIKLMQDDKLVQGALQAEEMPSHNTTDIATDLYRSISTVDLQQECPAKPLPRDIYDIQYLFHLDEDEQIVLDNIVCNRPYVYSGRFSEDQDIYELSKKLNPQPEHTAKHIFCDVLIHEADTVNFLTRHQNCCTHQFNLFSAHIANNIPSKELYIGIHQDKIRLVWRSKKLTVIPVFQHPLNGQQITFPLLRLLWEISNQDTFKFQPYLNQTSHPATYTPRFTWNKMVLQDRKWVIYAEGIKSQNQLLHTLKKREVECPINAGVMDQELILNWNEPDDLTILWKELQKYGKLNLMGAGVYRHSIFKSPEGNPVFPQFNYQRKVNPYQVELPRILNYLDEPAPSCLYFRIKTRPHLLIPLMKKALPDLIKELKASNPTIRWYFVLYHTSSYEIRLRFLDLNDSEKNHIRNAVYEKLLCGIAIQEATYYPEFVKYSHNDLQTSEKLFQWESELVLFTTPGLKRPLICSSDEFKVKLISEIWSQIFFQSEHSITYINHLKEISKNLPLSDIRKIRASFDQYLTPLSLPKIAKEYIKAIGTHEYHQHPSHQKKLLLNHFHMMANRFFLMDAVDYEEVSRYLTYRKLGRKMHLSK